MQPGLRTALPSDRFSSIDRDSVKHPSYGLVALLLIYAAFISLGLPDGILGAAWPQMRAQFAVSLNDNWPMLVLGVCGGLVSSVLSGPVLRWLGVSRVLVCTTLLTASVILGYAFANSFAVITALAFFLGLGNGAVDAGLNNLVANHLSSRHMSWLHAFWGVGVSLGTLLVSGVFAAKGSWQTAYLAVGLIQSALGVAFVFHHRLLREPPASADGGARREHALLRSTFGLPAGWASLGVFFVYGGLEASAGLWIASVLHDARGWSMEWAGLMATVYWASLTVGRFLTGTVSHWTTPFRIVRLALVGVIIGTSLIALSSATAIAASRLTGALTACGLLVTGLSLSPIFPMLMHDTPRCVGRAHSMNLIGMQSGAGSLGCAVVPSCVGTALRFGSAEWLGGMLLTLACATFGLLMIRERCVPRLS